MEKKQSLNKFFILMAIWLVTIMSVFAGSAIYDQFKSSEYDAIAQPYINKVVPEISKWDPVATRKLMAPEISKTIPDETFAKVMTLFSRLGAFQSMDEAKFKEIHEDQDTATGKKTFVTYNIDAKYENGDAAISLKLLFRDGSFEISRFDLSSEILSEPSTTKAL